MRHSEQKCELFSSEWCIVGYVSGVLWDLRIRSIVKFRKFVVTTDLIMINIKMMLHFWSIEKHLNSGE